jgi:hypothetical protein
MAQADAELVLWRAVGGDGEHDRDPVLGNISARSYVYMIRYDITS